MSSLSAHQRGANHESQDQASHDPAPHAAAERWLNLELTMKNGNRNYLHKPERCTCAYPLIVLENGSGHDPSCVLQQEWDRDMTGFVNGLNIDFLDSASQTGGFGEGELWY